MSSYKIKSCFDDSKIVVRTGENKKEKQIFLEIAAIIGLKTIPLSKRKPLILNSENLGIFIKKIDALRDKDKNQLKKLTIGIGGTGPYGYKRVALNKVTNQFVRVLNPGQYAHDDEKVLFDLGDPHEVETVKRIFQLKSEGLGYKKIAAI